MPTFPDSTSPMHAAIVAALTTYTGQPRCLPPDRLYTLGRPRDFAGVRPSDAYRRPLCWVAPPIDAELDGGMLLTDRARVEVVVEIRTWYYAGEGISTKEWDDARERYTLDAKLVREALTYPGALTADAAGTPTGLDGYALRSDGGRHKPDIRTLPALSQGQRELIVQVGHVFRATADLARVSTT